MTNILFPTGQTVVTKGIMDTCCLDDKKDKELSYALGFAAHVNRCYERHVKGDWGDICEADKALNQEALEHDMRVLSSYKHDGFPQIYIITEADRSVTTILYPSEY